MMEAALRAPMLVERRGRGGGREEGRKGKRQRGEEKEEEVYVYIVCSVGHTSESWPAT